MTPVDAHDARDARDAIMMCSIAWKGALLHSRNVVLGDPPVPLGSMPAETT